MSDPSDRAILDALLAGQLDREQALARLRASRPSPPPVESLDWARLDHDRAQRRGFPEVVYGPGKTATQVGEIVARLAAHHDNVLCTRTDEAALAEVRARLPSDEGLEFDPQAGLLYLWRDRSVRHEGTILVVTAGTSDQRVALEAQRCAQVMGNRVEARWDVGVAGLGRLLAERPALERARVIICIAGFEAALPSVVAGLVACPVIAVPTSTGYGATFGGLSALLSCLSSCAAGVTTVNIDNGFGAAYAATLINRLG